MGTTQDLDNKLQIVVGVTKAVGERFGKGGIADRAIWFNGFPFLDNKEEHTFGVPVLQAMTTEIVCLPSYGTELRDVEKVMADNKYQGYPVVEDDESKTLVGYIGRTELMYAIDRARRDQVVSSNAKCYFVANTTRATTTPTGAAPAVTFDTIAATSGQARVDFSRFVDLTPLTVHPRLPLETVMELFKKMGPRVIIVEHRGKLTGLITVKDCLKYQFKAEAQEHHRDESAIDAQQQKMWHFISAVGTWVKVKAHGISGGRLRLGDGDLPASAYSSPVSPRNANGAVEDDGQPERSDNGAGAGASVELEDRGHDHGPDRNR